MPPPARWRRLCRRRGCLGAVAAGQAAPPPPLQVGRTASSRGQLLLQAVHGAGRRQGRGAAACHLLSNRSQEEAHRAGDAVERRHVVAGGDGRGRWASRLDLRAAPAAGEGAVAAGLDEGLGALRTPAAGRAGRGKQPAAERSWWRLPGTNPLQPQCRQQAGSASPQQTSPDRIAAAPPPPPHVPTLPQAACWAHVYPPGGWMSAQAVGGTGVGVQRLHVAAHHPDCSIQLAEHWPHDCFWAQVEPSAWQQQQARERRQVGLRNLSLRCRNSSTMHAALCKISPECSAVHFQLPAPTVGLHVDASSGLGAGVGHCAGGDAGQSVWDVVGLRRWDKTAGGSGGLRGMRESS